MQRSMKSISDKGSRSPSIAEKLTLTLAAALIFIAAIGILMTHARQTALIKETLKVTENRSLEKLKLQLGFLLYLASDSKRDAGEGGEADVFRGTGPETGRGYSKEAILFQIQQLAEKVARNEFIGRLTIIDSSGAILFQKEQRAFDPALLQTHSIGYQDLEGNLLENLGLLEIGLTEEPYQEINRRFLWGSIITVLFMLLTLIAAAGPLLRAYLRRFTEAIEERINGLAEPEPLPPRIGDIPIEFLPIFNALDRVSRHLEVCQFERKGEEFLHHHFVENAAEGIFMTSGEGRFIYVNRTLAKMLGYDGPERLIGKGFEMLAQCFSGSERRLDLQRLLDDRDEAIGFALQLCRNEGGRIWVSITARGFRQESGNIRTIEGSVIDITERRRIESLQRAKMMAEAEQNVKNAFMANISHEIRTPMNAIVGLTNLLMKSGINAKQRDYLGKIRASAQILMGIVSDILDYSRIESGELELESAPFRLDDILENLSDIFARQAAQKHIEMIISATEDVPNALIGDRMRLEQVLIHLTGNALKFTNQGEVSIVAEVLEKTGDRTTLQFTLSDTGIGISQERIPRLFSSFHPDHTGASGAGRGLQICTSLVRLMGGEINVQSDPGQGSKFFFTAAFERQIETQEIRPEPPAELAGKRILLADDNVTARETVDRMLKSFSFQTVTAESGEAAMEIVSKGELLLDLAIIDWRMPGLDGLEISKRIQRITPDLPIIIMTEFGSDATIERAEAAGVDAFVIKPVKQSSLFDTIIEVFGEKVIAAYKGITARPDLQEEAKALTGADILLVEDNEINQEVVRELLEGVGIQVTIAANGKEAIQILEDSEATGKKFDSILMDIQMPVMDGYEATRQIRASDLSGRDLPIIAMTAHAFTSDRDKCFQAGMDDYIRKPVDVKQLFSALTRWVQNNTSYPERAESPTGATPSVKGLPPISGIDLNAALKRLGGNEELYRKLLKTFVTEYASGVKVIRSALDKGDMELVLYRTHDLKGLSGNIGATELHEALLGVEAELRHKEGENIDPLLDHLESLHRSLVSAIRSSGF